MTAPLPASLTRSPAPKLLHERHRASLSHSRRARLVDCQRARTRRGVVRMAWPVVPSCTAVPSVQVFYLTVREPVTCHRSRRGRACSLFVFFSRSRPHIARRPRGQRGRCATLAGCGVCTCCMRNAAALSAAMLREHGRCCAARLEGLSQPMLCGRGAFGARHRAAALSPWGAAAAARSARRTAS